MAGNVDGSADATTGYQAGRQCALASLATLKATLGTLSKVKQLVRTLGMVNAGPDFTDHVAVVNGFSDVMKEVFGEEVGIGYVEGVEGKGRRGITDTTMMGGAPQLYLGTARASSVSFFRGWLHYAFLVYADNCVIGCNAPLITYRYLHLAFDRVRSAVGMASLPFNIPVEVETTWELKDQDAKK